MGALSLAVLAGVFLILTYLIFLHPKRRGRNLPPIVGSSIPFLGCIKEFSSNPVACIRKSYEKHGDCFTLYLAGANMTFLIGPKAHETFFMATDEELSPREAYQFVVPVFGPGVVYDCPTSMMYEQLKFIKSGLVVAQLKKNVSIIEQEALAFFRKWGNSGEVDMLEEMNKLTVLTASRCLLGPEIRGDPKVSNEFAKLYHDLEGGLNPLAFFYPYFPIPAHRRRDNARKSIVSLFSKVIKQRRQLPPEEKHDDMLQILMESQYKNRDTLSDDAIAGMLVGMLFAGQHTSGITSTWTAFFLLQNEQYFNRVLQEQESIKKKYGDLITFESLKDSAFLEACIRESLRLFPPLICLFRKVKVPLQYGKYEIPVGDLLGVCPGVSMRLPDSFENPDTYDPNRFMTNEDKKQYSYLAFGGGRHGCPGENFGVIQIKTIWTILLRYFDMEMIGDFPKPDYTNLVVGPQQTCRIHYKLKKGINL